MVAAKLAPKWQEAAIGGIFQIHFIWTDISLGPLVYFSRVLFGDIPHAYFFSFELVVDGTADGKDN